MFKMFMKKRKYSKLWTYCDSNGIYRIACYYTGENTVRIIPRTFADKESAELYKKHLMTLRK